MVEMANQLAGKEIDEGIAALEAEPKAAALLKKLKQSLSRPDSGLSDWPTAVAEYLLRSFDLTVLYDGGYHSPERAGIELVQSVATAASSPQRRSSSAAKRWNWRRGSLKRKRAG